jgi:hypothetical protein
LINESITTIAIALQDMTFPSGSANLETEAIGFANTAKG